MLISVSRICIVTLFSLVDEYWYFGTLKMEAPFPCESLNSNSVIFSVPKLLPCGVIAAVHYMLESSERNLTNLQLNNKFKCSAFLVT
jgi:hypothetical protein